MKKKWIAGRWALACTGIALAMVWGANATAQATLWQDTRDAQGNIVSWGTQAIASETVPYDSNKHWPVTVIVVDTGVGKHASLETSIPSSSGSRLAIIDLPPNDPGFPAVGCYPHATHVSGIIGGNNKMRGVFPGVPIVSISTSGLVDETHRCLEDGVFSDERVKKALQNIYDAVYAMSDKDKERVSVVVNLSMGGLAFAKNGEVAQLMKRLATPTPGYPGVVIVQGGGNKHEDSCTFAYSKQNSDGSWSANAEDGIMVVSSLDRNGQPVMQEGFLTEDSTVADIIEAPSAGAGYGRCVDVWAPGHEIYSAWGSNNVESKMTDNGGITYSTHRPLSGASMATPHIAGLAAYLMATQYLKTPADVERAIRAQAADLGSTVRGDNYCNGPCPILVPAIPKLPPQSAKPSVIFKWLYQTVGGRTFYYNGSISGAKLKLPDIDWNYVNNVHEGWEFGYDSSGASTCKLTTSRNKQPWNDFTHLPSVKDITYTWKWNSIRTEFSDPGTYKWEIECSNDNGDKAYAEAELKITGNKLVCTLTPSVTSIPQNGMQISVEASCPGASTSASYKWAVDGVPSTQYAKGNILWYTFPVNNSIEQIDRVISVSVSADGQEWSTPAYTQVTQAGMPKPECTITPSTSTIPYSGGPQWASVSCSNLPAAYAFRWTVNGLVQGETGKQLSYTFPANTAATPIDWNIRAEVISGGAPVSDPDLITVTQAAAPQPKPVCTVVPDVWTIPSVGGSYSAKASCSGAPGAYTWTVNGLPQAETGNVLSYLFLPNNSASAIPFNIVVTASNGSGTSEPVQITVSQAAAEQLKLNCTIAPQVWTVPHYGGGYSATASCTGVPSSYISYSWTVNGYPQASTGNSINFDFPANNTATAIPFVINMTAVNNAGVTGQAQITVTQAAAPPQPKPGCSITPQVWTIPDYGGYYTATASCSGAPYSYSWTVNGYPQASTGNSIGFSFPRNNTAAAIPFTIVVRATNGSGTGDPAQITVNQAGLSRPVCSITPQAWTIPYYGGYYTATASCSGMPYSYSWTVNGYPQASTGNSIGFGFPTNNSTATIPFTIVVRATNGAGMGNPVQITVNQARK